MTRRMVQPARSIRLLALILALACQVVSGALLPAQAASAAPSRALAAATAFCESGHHPGEHQPAPHHHATDSALLRAAASAAFQCATPGGAPPALRLPSFTRICLAGPVRVRGPPACVPRSAYPRGPPILI